MRLFVAVDPGRRFREELSPALDEWRRRWPLRWVATENLHVTLRFLGDCPRESLADLRTALLAAVWKRRAFSIGTDVLGVFPDWRRPRVLFLQLRGDGSLEALAAEVSHRIAEHCAVPVSDAGPFRAHLTLARMKRPPATEHLDALRLESPLTLSAIPVGDIRLIESRLTSAGPHYEVLEVFPLATVKGT